MSVTAFPSFAEDAAAEFGVPDLTDALRSFLVSLTGWTPERVDEVMQAGINEALTVVDAPYINLTETERTVLSLAAGGLSGPAIAEHVCRSRETIKDHTKRIRAKFGVGTLEGAVFLGLLTGQIDFDQTAEALGVAA